MIILSNALVQIYNQRFAIVNIAKWSFKKQGVQQRMTVVIKTNQRSSLIL